MYLIPQPKMVKEGKGVFVVAYDTFICVDKSCSPKVATQSLLFKEDLKNLLGYELELTRGQSKNKDIVLLQDDAMKAESYTLEIEEQQVVLKGSESGLWYAMQTFLQIIEQEGATIGSLAITDEPEITNRGYYFDVTRGRIPTLEWLKRLADRLARYKINQLQLYVEHTYLFRDMPELWRDDTPLTAAEIMEYDTYCLDRGIELVPSLSSFGHLYKLLSAKSYKHLCELEDSDEAVFSVRGRMHHHTMDATNPVGIALIKEMITEFMGLFSSKQFNLCADETFDLGTGKGKAFADVHGKKRLYINYVKELCEFLVANGRRPMFWGDVILGFPELIKELPEETICLNWGYAWQQREDETRKMYEAGAVQYCCPGCCGWNMFINLNWYAYNNIKRLCTYAKKYEAIGLLNTDWGDYLHLNHPDFSIPGMIYGAAFSWNSNIPEFEDINRQISKLAFHDHTEQFLAIIAKIQDNMGFSWEMACRYMEYAKDDKEFKEEHKKALLDSLGVMERIDEKNANLLEIRTQIYGHLKQVDSDRKELIYPYIVAVDGMMLFHELGKYVMAGEFSYVPDQRIEANMLAAQLEQWMYHYKKIYRSISKEGELRRIQRTICFYGDYLRDYK